jgi:hypothetical protein
MCLPSNYGLQPLVGEGGGGGNKVTVTDVTEYSRV